MILIIYYCEYDYIWNKKKGEVKIIHFIKKKMSALLFFYQVNRVKQAWK